MALASQHPGQLPTKAGGLQLKELRAKRVKYEEEMTLAQVRASVGQLMDQQAADEERQAAVRCVPVPVLKKYLEVKQITPG